MKTNLRRLATACLTVVLLLSMTVVGSAKQTFSADNPCTAENFLATEGYEVYSIFDNENVKFFAKDPETGELKEYGNEKLAENGFYHNDLQFFAGSWYSYDGACLGLMNTGETYVEITFSGTAFNLGLVLYRGAASGINMDALITVDDEEYDLPMGALVCPDGDDLASRMCQPRYFQVAGLENGEHTVRIVSTGTERLQLEYYEVSDMVFEETEPAATEPAATEPAATEPAATEPKATEPKATEPAATEPAGTDAPAPAANGFPWVAVIVAAVVLAAVVIAVAMLGKKRK